MREPNLQSLEKIDLILVPGLAFSRDGERMGRGGGFHGGGFGGRGFGGRGFGIGAGVATGLALGGLGYGYGYGYGYYGSNDSNLSNGKA